MHEDAPVLTASKRDRVGSRYSKRLRDEGKLPAIVYGHKQDPVPIALPAHETLGMINNGERVFQLSVDNAQDGFVLLKDLQYDYLGTAIVHCDLERVDLDERVPVTVQLDFIGESECKALDQAGATLMHPATEIEIECAVFNLPDSIEVDLRNLTDDEPIMAKDVKLPKDTMKLLSDPNEIVAHIVFQSHEQEAGDEAGTVGGTASPEVITEKKDED